MPSAPIRPRTDHRLQDDHPARPDKPTPAAVVPAGPAPANGPWSFGPPPGLVPDIHERALAIAAGTIAAYSPPGAEISVWANDRLRAGIDRASLVEQLTGEWERLDRRAASPQTLGQPVWLARLRQASFSIAVSAIEKGHDPVPSPDPDMLVRLGLDRTATDARADPAARFPRWLASAGAAIRLHVRACHLAVQVGGSGEGLGPAAQGTLIGLTTAAARGHAALADAAARAYARTLTAGPGAIRAALDSAGGVDAVTSDLADATANPVDRSSSDAVTSARAALEGLTADPGSRTHLAARARLEAAEAALDDARRSARAAAESSAGRRLDRIGRGDVVAWSELVEVVQRNPTAFHEGLGPALAEAARVAIDAAVVGPDTPDSLALVEPILADAEDAIRDYARQAEEARLEARPTTSPNRVIVRDRAARPADPTIRSEQDAAVIR